MANLIRYEACPRWRGFVVAWEYLLAPSWIGAGSPNVKLSIAAHGPVLFPPFPFLSTLIKISTVRALTTGPRGTNGRPSENNQVINPESRHGLKHPVSGLNVPCGSLFAFLKAVDASLQLGRSAFPAPNFDNACQGRIILPYVFGRFRQRGLLVSGLDK